MKTPIKIVAVIEGGVLQSLYCSDANVDLEVIDFDNDEKDYDDTEAEMEQTIEGLNAIL